MSDYFGGNGTRIVVQSHAKPVWWARVLADLLTLSRLIGAILLALMSWEKTADSLGKLVRYSLLLWSTDTIDGRIARRSHAPPSWLGEHDILADSVLALGVVIALARLGYVSGTLIVAWLGLCLAIYAIRPVDTVILVFMLPFHLALPVTAFAHGLPEFKLYLVWVGAMAVANRSRLKWNIEVFINGLPHGMRRWISSWLPVWLRLTSDEREAFRARRRL